jgi:replicative DNA helicase
VNPADTIDRPLDTDEIARRLAAATTVANAQPTPQQPEPYRWFRPLEDAADEWVDWARHPERRIYTGIEELDAAMRGTAPGELTLIVGYAHSGKTVVTTQSILNNRDKRIALFTPDETRVLILIKLTSIIHGVSAEELERRVAMRDHTAEALVRSTAVEWFPNLAVFEQGMTLGQMDTALSEAEEHWDRPVDLTIYDYADLLSGVGEDTKSKIDALKGWGKNRETPLYVLHQSSRTKGSSGGKVTIDSGGFSGEQQATHLIGVRRKKNQITAAIEELEQKIRGAVEVKPAHTEQLEDLRADLRKHTNTITISLVKNKRPPSRLVDDIDFRLDKDTGRVEPMHAPPSAYQADTWAQDEF